MKILCLLLLYSISGLAQPLRPDSYIEQSMPMESHQTVALPSNLQIKELKKEGDTYLVPWNILALLDLKTNKPSGELTKIIGQKIKISGWVIPADFTDKYLKSFILSEVLPTCFHVPPPPDNQLILVEIDPKLKIESTDYPIELTGILELKKPDPKSMMPGLYQMKLTSKKNIKELKE